MIKALLITIIVATIAIPAVAARDPSPHRGLKKALFYMFVGELFIWFFWRRFTRVLSEALGRNGESARLRRRQR
jgi:hypothetical protein